MFERLNPVLKIVCLGLALLILAQISRLAVRKDGRHLILPLPTSALAASDRPSGKQPTNSPPGATAPKKAANIPSHIQTRVERITQSEILGPVVRPLPMALLGIAGRDAFLRSAEGQTGLVREGEVLGSIKLLRLGTNRVLIEHEGRQKELMLFSGMGGETLLPKESSNPP